MNKATIIGGSLTGLAAGILLRNNGWDVQLYERSPNRLSDRGAGIVMQTATREMLRMLGGAHDTQVAVPMTYRKYLKPDGSILSSDIMPQLMTSWGLLYTWLKRGFPAEHYHTGEEFVGFNEHADSTVAHFQSGLQVSADLLLAADGIRSTTRRLVLPDLRPEYAGYVAWRGVIEEREAPEEALAMFHDSFTFYQMPGSHIFCYLIPDGEGNTTVGHRRLNWVWYWNTSRAELEELLTDKQGQRRTYAVSPGAIQPALEQRQRQLAEDLLPPVFKQLIRATEHPFIQAIIDLNAPRMVFGRTLLLGDASCILRPHTAAGTEKGVANAFTLARAVSETQDVDGALRQWQATELVRSQELARYGQGMGDRSQRPGNLANKFSLNF
jgi:2-polyprenyl-6-methoxyphenol hydroxylase-like FAD-dependent oxidoreductase